jgi:hypothetical protein
MTKRGVLALNNPHTYLAGAAAGTEIPIVYDFDSDGLSFRINATGEEAATPDRLGALSVSKISQLAGANVPFTARWRPMLGYAQHDTVSALTEPSRLL